MYTSVGLHAFYSPSEGRDLVLVCNFLQSLFLMISSMSFSGHVLAHHHFGVLEHLCPGDGALPAASLARRLPGDHQLVLRCPLHIRNVPQNVQLRVSGEKTPHQSINRE